MAYVGEPKPPLWIHFKNVRCKHVNCTVVSKNFSFTQALFMQCFFLCHFFSCALRNAPKFRFKQTTVMLPIELEEMIQDYAKQMGDLESLPEINAVFELVQKSNRSLVSIGNYHFNIPLPVMIEIHLRDDFSLPLVVNFQFTPQAVQDLNDTLSMCVFQDWATSAVFWLFIQRDPNLYHGPYAQLFEESLLFKLLNVVTSLD